MSRDYATAQEAETAFYAAFRDRNLDAMMTVWADANDVICIHPTGPMLVGREAIRASWTEIFKHAGRIQFVVDERRRSLSDSLALHVVQEHLGADKESGNAPILATNVYQLTETGWRMILHHASPSPRRVKSAGETLH